MILDIVVTQDSVGIQTNDGLTIDTNQIRTQVLVNNADTLVLGGVYRVETVESTSQVPLLGSIPIIGSLFKNKISSEQKNELLIFITPRLINDGIVLK